MKDDEVVLLRGGAHPMRPFLVACHLLLVIQRDVARETAWAQVRQSWTELGNAPTRCGVHGDTPISLGTQQGRPGGSGEKGHSRRGTNGLVDGLLGRIPSLRDELHVG